MNKTTKGARKPSGDWNDIKPYTRIIPDKRRETARKDAVAKLRKRGVSE